MAERVLLHVGMQKTGTTYLQAALVAAEPALRAAGVVYPRPRSGSLLSHQLAFYGLVGPEIPHVTDEQSRSLRPHWDGLAQQVAAQPGTVLLSCESLSFIRTRSAADILQTLRGLGVQDVGVLITGRDVGRLLVSGWQQHIRNGRTAALGEFLTARARDRELAEQDVADDERVSIWRAYSVAGVASRWAQLLAPDRVAVVTTRPGAPTHVLWDRFITALGVPQLAGLPAPEVPVDRANIGMRWPEADVMGAVNAALIAADWPEGRARTLRAHVINHGFLPRADRGTAIGIPPQWVDQVAEWGKVELERLHALVDRGLAVHGALDDLRYEPKSPAGGAAGPGTPVPGRAYPEEELLAAAGAAVVAAAGYVGPDDLPAAVRKATGHALRQTRQSLGRVGGERPDQAPPDGPGGAGTPAAPDGPGGVGTPAMPASGAPDAGARRPGSPASGPARATLVGVAGAVRRLARAWPGRSAR